MVSWDDPCRGGIPKLQALEEACIAQHEMPIADGARDCWLFIDAVCEIAAVVATMIREGVTMARDKPTVVHSAASM